MNLTRRSFLGSLLAGGVALLVDEHGAELAEPIPVSDELVIPVGLVIDVPVVSQGALAVAFQTVQYIASARAALGVGERWRETIVLPHPCRLERLVIPSALASRVVVHSIRADAKMEALAGDAVPGDFFNEVAFGMQLGMVARFEFAIEIERVS